MAQAEWRATSHGQQTDPSPDNVSLLYYLALLSLLWVLEGGWLEGVLWKEWIEINSVWGWGGGGGGVYDYYIQLLYM